MYSTHKYPYNIILESYRDGLKPYYDFYRLKVNGFQYNLKEKTRNLAMDMVGMNEENMRVNKCERSKAVKKKEKNDDNHFLIRR